jgi:putative ABC transport system permease protein
MMLPRLLSRTVGAAANALLRHRMRTLLTTLGISIGIAAVVCTVALGAGSAARVTAQLDNLGDDFLWIEPGSASVGGARQGWGNARTLVDEDAFAIARLVPDIAMCSPQFDGRVQAIVGRENWNTRYLGVSPDLFEIRRWQLATGTFFAEYDVLQRTPVVVLGEAVALRLFGGENPVGRTVRLDRVTFQILGVLQSKGASGAGVDRDDVVFLPYTTARRHFYEREWIDDIYCSVRDPERMQQAEAQVVDLLRARHELDPDEENDFNIRRPEEMINLRAASSRTLAVMLTAIAAVSLVVGGVGVMNIMLVSVTERTREIGLRLAVGARIHDIRLQFLAEALILGLVGGVFGVSMGWLGSELLTGRLGWTAIISPEAITAAVVTAVGTGLIFGYYPAHRASGLDPIEALRAEH